MDILDYFNLDDGLDIVWYHAANSHEKLEEALKTTMMIEGDITLRWAGLPNQVIITCKSFIVEKFHCCGDVNLR